MVAVMISNEEYSIIHFLLKTMRSTLYFVLFYNSIFKYLRFLSKRKAKEIFVFHTQRNNSI